MQGNGPGKAEEKWRQRRRESRKAKEDCRNGQGKRIVRCLGLPLIIIIIIAFKGAV